MGFFPVKRKQGLNNGFRSLILSVFTTVASRLKSGQKEKERNLKLNTMGFKLKHDLNQSILNIKMLQLVRIE